MTGQQATTAGGPAPQVTSFFDAPTNTITHVVCDPASRAAAIIDSVLDFDPASGRTGTGAADTVSAFIDAQGLEIAWHLETHVHADHLSAASLLKARFGGQTGIGAGIRMVQATFGDLFNAEPAFARDGSQFDRLFADGESFAIGGLPVTVLHTPGHTPACTTYVAGPVAFVGDTLFMPDFGTARADFPGGDARTLYRSIRRILSLPDETRLYLCHDYKAPGREVFAWETTVAEERAANIHVRDGIDEETFTARRQARDATLSMPRLLLPSVQVNMRAGELPPPEDNGVRYLKLPLDIF